MTTNQHLYDLAKARFDQSTEIPLRFFEAQADNVARACLAMARRFYQDGRLLAFGAGNSLTDAQHVSVEFVHPVIVGKRALPALALGTDIAATVGSAVQDGWEQVYARQLSAIGRPTDIALGIDPSGNDKAVINGLECARELGMLTIGLAGHNGGVLSRLTPDFWFVAPTDDMAVIQETHETLYHVLWELVHVFFDHKGLLEQDEAREDAFETCS